MVRRAKFALQVRLIQMFGPGDEDDLILMYGLQTGQIPLDRDWDKIGPAEQKPDQAEEQRRFTLSMVAAPRYYSDAQRSQNANSYPRGSLDALEGSSVNPFAPQTLAQGQLPKQPFYGGPVPSVNQYPMFLRNAIANVVNGPGTAAPPGAAAAAVFGGQ